MQSFQSSRCCRLTLRRQPRQTCCLTAFVQQQCANLCFNLETVTNKEPQAVSVALRISGGKILRSRTVASSERDSGSKNRERLRHLSSDAGRLDPQSGQSLVAAMRRKLMIGACTRFPLPHQFHCCGCWHDLYGG